MNTDRKRLFNSARTALASLLAVSGMALILSSTVALAKIKPRMTKIGVNGKGWVKAMLLAVVSHQT